jgi:hypothetical protein
MKDIYHRKGPDVYQHHMPADELMAAVRRRRRQTPFQLFRAPIHLFPEARRQRAPRLKLPFQSRRQPVPLGQAGRQMIVVIAIPGPHLVAIMIVVTAAVFMPLMSVPVSVPVISVPSSIVIPVFMFIVTVTAILRGNNGVAAQYQECRHTKVDQSFCSHAPSRTLIVCRFSSRKTE